MAVSVHPCKELPITVYVFEESGPAYTCGPVVLDKPNLDKPEPNRGNSIFVLWTY